MGAGLNAVNGVRIEHYGPNRTRCWFDCPRRPGEKCNVLLKPWPIKDVSTWTWDGNEQTPTLSPSINCNGPGGCGWHGFIKKGEVVGA